MFEEFGFHCDRMSPDLEFSPSVSPLIILDHLGSSWIRSQDERLPDPTKPFPAAPIAFFFQVAGTCRDQGWCVKIPLRQNHANRANRARVTVPVASSHSSRSINHTDTIRCLLSRFCWSMTLEWYRRALRYQYVTIAPWTKFAPGSPLPCYVDPGQSQRFNYLVTKVLLLTVLCLCSSPACADFLQQVSPKLGPRLFYGRFGVGSWISWRRFRSVLFLDVFGDASYVWHQFYLGRILRHSDMFFHMLDTCLKTCLKACLQTSLDIWRFWIASCLFLSILRVAKDPTDAEHSLPRSVEEGSMSRPWPGWRAPMVWWLYFL